MVLRNAYVVARGSAGRPTCQHRLKDGQATLTACGQDMSAWSRSYTNGPLEAILCKRANCWLGGGKR